MIPGKPFNPYGMFYGALVPRAILARTDLTCTAKLLWGVLNSHCKEDGLVYPAQTKLAKDMGMSLSNVRKGLDQLVEAGLIKVIPPTGEERLKHLHNKYAFLWQEWMEEGTKVAIPTNDADCYSSGGPQEPPSGGAQKAGEKKAVEPEGSSPTATSAKFQKKWHTMFKEHHGRPYLETSWARFGKQIQSLYKALDGDLSRFKEVVRHYFADAHPYVQGHELGKLVQHLPKYLEEPRAPGSNGNGHPYSEDAPVKVRRIEVGPDYVPKEEE